MSRALLLAAGEMTRWGNHLNTPKHLIPIQGEPLIHRTQRQLRERGITDIHVVCQVERAPTYVAAHSRWAEPHWRDRDMHQHESSRHLWHPDDPTLIIYGDTYLTDELADTIATDPGDPWHIYARHDASTITGRKWGEMFAWVIAPSQHHIIDQATNDALHAKRNGLTQRLLGWEIYRCAVGIPIDKHRKEDTHFVEWDDASDDFDYPNDYETWRALNPHLA